MIFRWIFFRIISFFTEPPQYTIGSIVKARDGQFIVLRTIRWIRLNNYPRLPKWQWVYDGIELEVANKNISFSTGIFTLTELEIMPVLNLS